MLVTYKICSTKTILTPVFTQLKKLVEQWHSNGVGTRLDIPVDYLILMVFYRRLIVEIVSIIVVGPVILIRCEQVFTDITVPTALL